jgi:hypothetical protein
MSLYQSEKLSLLEAIPSLLLTYRFWQIGVSDWAIGPISRLALNPDSPQVPWNLCELPGS